MPDSTRVPSFEEVRTGGGCCFVLESSQGIVFRKPHFPVWSTFDQAEKAAKELVADPPLKASRVDFRELQMLLRRMQEIGLSDIALDEAPGTPARVVLLADFISFVDSHVKRVNPFRASFDYFPSLLERKRAAGLPMSAEDDCLPIDCPHCEQGFSVTENSYRRWRTGETPMLCPHCIRTFQEAPFGSIQCTKCGAHSGLVPPSLCRAFVQQGQQWQCEACMKPAIQAEVQAVFEKAKRRHG